jgi:hypothetical protein
MTGTPPQDPGTRDNVHCPRCDVLVPAGQEVCPFCRQPVAPEKEEEPRDIRKFLVTPERFPALKKLYREQGKWFKVAVPVLVGVPVLWILFTLVTRLAVTIPGDPAFPIEVVQVKKGGRTVLLKGELTNLGEDVPDLSLRSIGVTAEFRMADGREESKRVFPKSPFRGEGALFHGESGAFEIEVPKGAKAVTLRAEIVNLGEGSPFGFTGNGTRRLPKGTRR